MQEILDLFTELYEKQDILSKLTQSSSLQGYGYSVIHCLDAIGILDDPNVTKIAEHLKMTRGAISKITKKLITNNLITTYQSDNNKKEIYFKLTSAGERLFLDHQARHQKYIARDITFFEQQDTYKMEIVKEFLNEFNDYLNHQIEELSK